MSGDLQVEGWQRLQGLIAQEVLTAPKTGGDPDNQGRWPAVHESVVGYLARSVAGSPWADHLALAASVLAANRRQPNTIKRSMQALHPRFAALFPALGIAAMTEWDATSVFRSYLRGEILPDDPETVRKEFWNRYTTCATHVSKWVKSLPKAHQRQYERFLLPLADPGGLGLAALYSRVLGRQRTARKTATDAVVPQLPQIRAYAQYRLNRLTRLRQAYQDALKQLTPRSCLPFSFSYEEGADPEQGTPPQERLSFRIWDRRSFVLAHSEHYSPKQLDAVHSKTGTYTDERNRYFLELVGVERLVGDGPPEGLWFMELLQRGLLGVGPKRGSPEEVRAKQEYLRAWGYGDEDSGDKLTAPFNVHVGSLMQWSREEGRFMAHAQRVAQGVLIPVDSLYAATTFGMFAVDIFTTTGMRINEAMQIRPTADCLVRLEMPAPPEAKDPSPRTRYVLRLIPKGERADNPHDYFIGPEQVRLFAKVAKMLAEHYGLKPGENLPRVRFDQTNDRAFRFKELQPFLLQYTGRHLCEQTITACMRFILHGMVFKAKDGENVVVTAHLLRHAFATHAVQVLKIPVDIVGGWLQQKDLRVTEYYSAPTETMLAEHHDQLLTRFAAHVNVGRAVLRSPDELKQMYEEARGKAGTLADVPGGQCVSHGFCAAKFACVGCAGKVPDPAKRHQLVTKRSWAHMQLDYCLEEGLLPEAERMKQLIRDCDNELAEMDLIESYRRDSQRVALIQLDPFE